MEQAGPLPPGVMCGTVCRVNFWMKMTTALGMTQILIGVACIVFYSVAYYTDVMLEHLAAYIAVGVLAGSVVCDYLDYTLT